MPPEAISGQQLSTEVGAGVIGADPVEEAFVALAQAWTSAQLYPAGHPALMHQVGEAERAFDLALCGAEEVSVKHISGELVDGSRRLFIGRPVPEGFIAAICERTVQCITLCSGVNARELSSLVEALCANEAEMSRVGGVKGFLSRAGVRQVRIDQLMFVAGDDESTRLSEVYGSALSTVRGAMHSVRVGREIDVSGAAVVNDEMVARIAGDASAGVGLASLKGHDEYSFEHSVHASLMSLSFGEALGFNPAELQELGVAAMLHDVGKAHVPNEVLRKPGRLSQDEWESIQRHPVDGAATLLEHPDLPPSAAIVAFEHHMKTDLTGYPRTSTRRELSILSRIVALMDVYDALTTHRPYRPPLRPDQAIGEMKDMTNGHLDPKLVEWFADMLGEYPAGTCVQLDTKECGVACARGAEDGARPDVVVAVDARGRPAKEPFVAELTARRAGGAFRRSVVRTMNAGERGIDPNSLLDRWLRGEFPHED